MSNSNSETISVRSVYADSANLQAINSNSIVNAGSLTTGSLTANDAAQFAGNLAVNANAVIRGNLKVGGTLSFNNITVRSDDSGFTVDGLLKAPAGAEFPGGTVIGLDTADGGVVRGIVSANILRASDLFYVGDSALKIEARTRRIDADTFTEYLAKLVSDEAAIASAVIETARFTQIIAEQATINKLAAVDITANTIETVDFVAHNSLSVKDLQISGSEIIGGGVTINGSGRSEGSLVVNNNAAIFNKGIKVFSNEGTMTQTLSIIGTTDTTGDTTAETEEEKYALRTSVGVRALFMGDITVQDSQVLLDNSTLLGEKVQITKLTSADPEANILEFIKDGTGWERFVETQITFAAATETDEVNPITVEDIEARAKKEYTGPVADITSRISRRSGKTEKEKREAAKRIAARNSLTRAFTIKDKGIKYRFDADGNVLAKNIVTENARISKLTASDIAADTISVNSFNLENVVVEGIIGAASGVSVSGTSEISGTVYSYGNIIQKEGSSVEFKNQATETFRIGSTLKVEGGASLITDDDADVSLHGNVEIDVSNLILFNSKTGKRYHLTIRDAVGDEGDEDGDIAIEFGQIEEEPAAGSTLATSTRSNRKLKSEVAAFQATLKRI